MDFIESNRDFMKSYTTLDLSYINFQVILYKKAQNKLEEKLYNNIIFSLIQLLNIDLKNEKKIDKISLEGSFITNAMSNMITNSNFIDKMRIEEINITNIKLLDDEINLTKNQLLENLKIYYDEKPYESGIWHPK